MALAPGTILGQYEIRSPLGAGGMGEVYLAHDTRLKREVAIKVLPESLTADPDRLRRFEQEARAAAALNHPNILAVYQMATHDGLSYLVSELLEGETLRERPKRGPVALRKSIEYGVQIAHGLAAAHDKGIVHRDLKPENLFLTKDGRVKILDFGLAKMVAPPVASADDRTVALNQGTEPGVVMGTVGYMSPEQVRGKSADHRSDIFAFGTILYELISGKQTFRKPTSAETMTAILNEEPAPISQLAPEVPPGLQRVVHRCLEKNPEQRFQSASDLAFALEALSDSAITSPTAAHVPQNVKPNRMRTVVAGAVVVVLLLAATLAYFWMQPPAAPTVSNFVQLTHDGRPKNLGATDGSRLYLYVSAPDYVGMAEMSVSGGEPRKLAVLPSTNMFPRALSPDGSELLVVDGHGIPARGPFWSLPVLGGSPRRLGDIVGQDASWSPDGKSLAYGNESELFVSKADGVESRKLVTLTNSDLVFGPTWSPDGTHLRFTDSNFSTSASSIWEISVDGKELHPLFPGWHNPPNECCGAWTPDGRYFLFLSENQIWALPRKGGLFASQPKPIQLTSSPMALSAPLPSKDGKKIFTVGATTRGELTRYDLKSGKFESFLGGISAEYVAFSKDRQWVAYVSYPDGALWRSKADGSERLQLTYPPDYILVPQWSSDGKKIVFFSATNVARPARIYAVSREGGTPRQLMPDDQHPQQDPNWSPDGKKIVFAGGSTDTTSEIRILDLTTSQVSTIPGSKGFFSPRWSADGRYIPALSADSSALMLFDIQAQKWAQLATGTMGWLNWSTDGKYLYAIDSSGSGTVLKVRLSDRKVERLVDLKNFVTTGHFGTSLSIAPDDSPLLLRDTGTYDVYALDWDER